MRLIREHTPRGNMKKLTKDHLDGLIFGLGFFFVAWLLMFL